MLNPEEDQKFDKKQNIQTSDEQWPHLNIEELSEYQ
jgi:hypothetical protein